MVLFGYIGLGLMSFVLGCGLILYVYAFASMVNPELTGGHFWRKVLDRMFSSGAVVPTGIGLTLVLAGAVTMTRSAAAAAGMIEDRLPNRNGWLVLSVGCLLLLALLIIVIGFA